VIELAWDGLLAAGAFAIFGLWVHASRHSSWFVLVPLSVVAIFTPRSAPDLYLGTVAGIQVRLIDVVAVVAATSALTRWPSIVRRLGRARWAALGVTVFTAASLVAGAAAFGTGAWVSGSSLPVALALGSYMLSMPDAEESLEVGLRWLALTGLALCGVAAFNWWSTGLGTADESIVIDGSLTTGRILVSWQALMVAAAGLVLVLLSWQRRSARALSGALLCLLVVVLAQHRSVWVATVAGVIVVLYYLGQRRGLAAGLVCVWALLLLSPLSAAAPVREVLAELSSSLASASTSSGTGGTRFLGAGVIVQQQLEQGPWTILFGSPFGTPWNRVIEGTLVTFQPHNLYVEMFARVGLVGLLLLVALLLVGFRRQLRSRGLLGPVVAAALVYGLSYGLPVLLAPLLGLALVPRPTSGEPAGGPALGVTASSAL
jgi:hypothetical protein